MPISDDTRLGVWKAILDACNKTIVLMATGVENYVTLAAITVSQIAAEISPTPIYPLMNEEWKSDSWLTGLVANRLASVGRCFNKENIGFALPGKMKQFKPATAAQVDHACAFMTIDDASYSGTQLEATLLNFMGSKVVANIQKWLPKAFLLLAGISRLAREKLEKYPPVRVIAQTEMPWGPFSNNGAVIAAMRSLPGYDRHIELHPSTLIPRFTTHEMASPFITPFSYAILPYKIPDSISVPTHIYSAYNYVRLPMLSSRLPRQRNPHRSHRCVIYSKVTAESTIAPSWPA